MLVLSTIPKGIWLQKMTNPGVVAEWEIICSRVEGEKERKRMRKRKMTTGRRGIVAYMNVLLAGWLAIVES